MSLSVGLTTWIQEAPAAVSGSGGHNATFNAACALWRMLDDEAEVWDGLQLYNSSRCAPPWHEKDLRRKMEEAAKKTAGNRRPNSRPPGKSRKPSSIADIHAALAAPPDHYAKPRPKPPSRPEPPRTMPTEPVPSLAPTGSPPMTPEPAPTERPTAEVAHFLDPEKWGGGDDPVLRSALEKVRSCKGGTLTDGEHKRLVAEWLPLLAVELNRIAQISPINRDKARRMTQDLQRTVEPHLRMR